MIWFRQKLAVSLGGLTRHAVLSLFEGGCPRVLGKTTDNGIKGRSETQQLYLESSRISYETLEQITGLEVVKRAVAFCIGLW
jgi:hypothetical protein